MTPDQAVRSLRRQISAHGQDATYVHLSDDGKKIERALRIFVRGYAPNELGGGIHQGDSQITIVGPDWTALELGELPLPLSKVRVGNRSRRIENVVPFYIQDVLVRINIQVRG